MGSIVERRPLFQLYSFFTLGLALLFLGFYLFEEQLQWWQPTSPKLLPIVLTGYLALAVGNIIRTQSRAAQYSDAFFPSLLAEVLLLGVLMIYLTPQQQDLKIFMLISVGLGNVMTNQRFGYFLAAMGTLSVLTASYLNSNFLVGDQILSGTFVSISLFIEAIIIQALKTRLLEAQTHVEQTQSKLHSIDRINSLIIDRMLTGVCLVNNAGSILRINSAAIERLPSKENLTNTLFERLQYWHEYQLQNESSLEIQLDNGKKQSLLISFASIDDSSTLIFIEDRSALARKSQQFKLASLARMAASIAHEIRNPLNAISHASQLLQENDSLTNEDRRLCDIILNHGKRMEKIIENVLQISRRNSSAPQWIQLDTWLEKFVDDFCLQHNIAFNIHITPQEIRFDPSQLHQVLWNLCSNSVNYAYQNKSGIIDIIVSKTKQRVTLILQDQGPGISEKELPYLFEPFHTTSPQGTGLGLYIVKELCEANHAEIHYHDKPHCGANFEIIFAPDFTTSNKGKP